jgi:dATP pyrophosphohydrolase
MNPLRLSVSAVRNHNFKRPESVLVVVTTQTGKVLLLRRTDHTEFWQSITGSLHWGETAAAAAVRELREETGLEAPQGLRDWVKTYRYEILPQWRRRYAPGTCENTEHVFSLELADESVITVNPAEHTVYAWMSFEEAQARASSWSNRDAIRILADEQRYV